jgi:hypothetical protein
MFALSDMTLPGAGDGATAAGAPSVTATKPRSI